MVGSLVGYEAVVGKVHWRIFLAMKSFDDNGGVLELLGVKMGWPE